MNADVSLYIISSDPGFLGITTSGEYRFDRDGLEVVMSTEEYFEEHPSTAEEEFYALMHLTMAQVSNMQFVPNTTVVDALLDLRGAFQEFQNQAKIRQRAFYELWVAAQRRNMFYADKFGAVDIPNNWEPPEYHL